MWMLDVSWRRVSRALGGLLIAAAPLTTTVAAAPALPVPHPIAADAAFLKADPGPPTEAQCNTANASTGGRRCFFPAGIRNSYNLGPLYAQNLDGRGVTIAIVDSFGAETAQHDLHVFDSAMHLQPMCGEEGVTCTAGMPTFRQLHVQGSPTAKPTGQNGTGQEDRSLWSLEVALDVEWAHVIAPMANILLVTTPTAETLGVQGFPQMMNAEQYVIDNHLAQVISQSFASAEEAFNSRQSLENLRHAFKSAPAAGVTILGSSGDGGAANSVKQPPKNPRPIPTASVEWPASDPLVTGVGGTYLCTNPIVGSQTADDSMPPTTCTDTFPGVREPAWVGSGGGFSHVFSRPSYQSTLPAGSTAIPAAQRGVPDIGLQASSRTGVLIYSSEPGQGVSSTCAQPNTDCAGWWVIGGTSASAPQWAGLVAIADQINGGGLGLINPGLYAIGSNPGRYAADFYDVTVGSQSPAPDGTGYSASTGWDPVTGLGTPNAAVLVPDLVAAVHGH
jgi:subtilase family serine protease